MGRKLESNGYGKQFQGGTGLLSPKLYKKLLTVENLTYSRLIMKRKRKVSQKGRDGYRQDCGKVRNCLPNTSVCVTLKVNLFSKYKQGGL